MRRCCNAHHKFAGLNRVFSRSDFDDWAVQGPDSCPKLRGQTARPTGLAYGFGERLRRFILLPSFMGAYNTAGKALFEDMIVRVKHKISILVTCYVMGVLAATVSIGAEPKATPADAHPSSKRYTVKLNSGDNVYVGHPIVHNDRQTVLVRRNGRIKIFDANDVDKVARVSSSFTPKTGRQLRVELQKEFGSKYEVSLTKHYVVVHPPGAYKKWALPFEQFYIRFRQSLTARGMSLKQPEFPMVAIVLLNRREYSRFTSKYTSFSFATDGYYNAHSNRMITYDKGGNSGQSSSAPSFQTMTTVIHEATHQAAHNVGIHSRFFQQPLWFKEGLATLFEAPGINNPIENRKPADRINRNQLFVASRGFKKHEKPGVVELLVRSDGAFKRDAGAAYAISWAMSSYLFEKFPRNYIRYIKLMNLEPKTSSRTPDERLKVFTDSFGSPERIEGGVRAYISGLSK